MKYKSVVVIWNFAHYLDFRLDDLLHVAAHAFRIVVSFTVDYDPVCDAFDVEDQGFEVADFKWRVVKDVEVLGAKSILLAQHCGQSGRDFPNVRREHAHG